MDFLTDAELEDYYGKPASEVSPTDTPRPEYICGQETTDCMECGAELEVRCAAFNGGHSDGYVDIAYCESCELEHRRTRSPVCDHINYQSGAHRTDEREEYVCSDCRERHPITEPTDTFAIVDTPSVTSFEKVTVPCPCGERIQIGGVEFSSTVPCPGCSRTYAFEMHTK